MLHCCFFLIIFHFDIFALVVVPEWVSWYELSQWRFNRMHTLKTSKVVSTLVRFVKKTFSKRGAFWIITQIPFTLLQVVVLVGFQACKFVCVMSSKIFYTKIEHNPQQVGGWAWRVTALNNWLSGSLQKPVYNKSLLTYSSSQEVIVLLLCLTDKIKMGMDWCMA